MSDGLDAEFYFTGLSKKVLPRTYVEHYDGYVYNPEEVASRLAAENQFLRHRIAVLEKEIALVRASLHAQPAQSDGHK